MCVCVCVCVRVCVHALHTMVSTHNVLGKEVFWPNTVSVYTEMVIFRIAYTTHAASFHLNTMGVAWHSENSLQFKTMILQVSTNLINK